MMYESWIYLFIYFLDASGIYTVTPPCCDILPMKSAEFRVAFLPKLPNKLFGKQLECYVSYKVCAFLFLIKASKVTECF